MNSEYQTVKSDKTRLKKMRGMIVGIQECDVAFFGECSKIGGLQNCSIIVMDKVKAELTELRLTMQQASERLEILDKRIADSDHQINNEEIFFNEDVNRVDLIDRAEKYLHWGRLKSRSLDTGNGLFADSCWIMCLDIYVCDLKDERVTVSAIAHSSGIPMTTAMRYINVMAEQGLIVKTPNPADNRMVFVSASDDCRNKIEALLSSAPF